MRLLVGALKILPHILGPLHRVLRGLLVLVFLLTPNVMGYRECHNAVIVRAAFRFSAEVFVADECEHLLKSCRIVNTVRLLPHPLDQVRQYNGACLFGRCKAEALLCFVRVVIKALSHSLGYSNRSSSIVG